MTQALAQYEDQQDREHLEHEIGQLMQELAELRSQSWLDNWWKINSGFPLLSRSQVVDMMADMVIRERGALVEASLDMVGVDAGMVELELAEIPY